MYLTTMMYRDRGAGGERNSLRTMRGAQSSPAKLKRLAWSINH